MYYALVMFRATTGLGEDKAGELPFWQVVSGPHRAPIIAEDRAQRVLKVHNHLWQPGSKRAIKYAVVKSGDLHTYGLTPAALTGAYTFIDDRGVE